MVGMPSVANSSDGLIFGKRQAKDGRFFLAKIRALDGQKDGQNSSFVLKKRVNSTRDVLTTKVRKSTQFLDESSFRRNLIQHVI